MGLLVNNTKGKITEFLNALLSISHRKQFNVDTREVNDDVYGKRKTVGSCVSKKHENLRFLTCLTRLRSYSIYLVNRQERSLIKSSFSVFWQKENFILPFAVNVMLNLSKESTTTNARMSWMKFYFCTKILGHWQPGLLTNFQLWKYKVSAFSNKFKAFKTLSDHSESDYSMKIRLYRRLISLVLFGTVSFPAMCKVTLQWLKL